MNDYFKVNRHIHRLPWWLRFLGKSAWYTFVWVFLVVATTIIAWAVTLVIAWLVFKRLEA